MKIAYLGPKGTFTEKISKELFPNEELIPLQPIRNVIFAVENDKADFAVVPLENFYNGEVRETLDSLNECQKAGIIQEKSLEIVHCLGALKEHQNISKILSKDQALEQCSHFLMDKFPEAQTIAVSSTAEAVRKIKSENILDSAVIASKEAILESELEILNINLVPNNKTRFVVIGKTETKPTSDDKTLISIHPPKDKAGVLYGVLGFLANAKINLEDIKSRPDK
ncbi:prephenate dehydratase, partial [Candidatus Pacearchaeota archaeon]|nr:prephenate dehydratase [Candidatus Pacearchaeota archaeon]